MAGEPPRIPPRFVPTLTLVAEESEPAPAAPAEKLVPAPAPAPTPTPTETPTETPAAPVTRPVVSTMVQAPPLEGAEDAGSANSANSADSAHAADQAEPKAQPPDKDREAVSFIALDPATRFSEAESFRLEEQLLHRVLQRVDASLEAQLSDTVAEAVQHQLDAMIPRLRSEIETVLRALVIEALASELSENPGSVPPGDARSLG
ncbi:conserved hypothetical protein [Burkholderiales bacterium 8X]|nr:conserved hypothetical protein [Burkholderiales bacterium 8X]